MNMNNAFLTDNITKAVREHMGAQVSDIKFIGGGSFGKVFKGKLQDGTAVALKAYRVNGWELKEAAQLKALSAATSVKVPEVFFTHSSEDCDIMAMEFIKGENALNPLFVFKSKAQKQAFADEVTNGLLEIHGTTNDKYGDILNPTHTSWLEYFRTQKIEPGLAGLGELRDKGKYGKKAYDRLLKATEIFYKIAEEPESPVLIHSDINIMNIMVDPKSLKLVGFIDPGGIAWADREYDLFQLRNMWGDSFGLYEAYKAKHKTSEYCDFKVAYYGALNEAMCRLAGGLIMPVWEVLCNRNLDIAMRNMK